jgi:DNA-binding CsgD family transcriptional regulator
MAATFILFSSPLPAMVGLTASPLPAGSLYMAALLGISVARQSALADGQDILLAVIAAIVSPALALMFAYCLGRIMDGGGAGNLIVLCLAVLAAVMMVYTRWQNRRTMHRQIVANREQQVYSTQKSLSALEVKAEMTEKDLLNKLDIKRKELVDFAVGVSDQKEFMEKVYEDLKTLRTLDDENAKNAATDTLLSTLRERMYFTREMNDFYAQSEVLNKDFNMRLSELFPNLTDGERKLTNLLRQGFSSKYIASLMNITPKSVEINRSRLRAKLGLTRGDNLIQFIKSI